MPGEYAVLEAHRALTRNLHVFLFSDHVSVEDEIALKRRGAERGRLVMGPECGTAMLGGVGLGFANVVRRGPVGIVAAAGTGAQEASVLLDRAGAGVSQIIGVGGRDLSAQVGGIMFRQGMELLAADDETETLLLVSKPPDADAVRALGDVDTGGKRVVAAFVGWDGGEAPFEVHPTLEAGALAAAGAEPPARRRPRRCDGGGDLLGLFSGGSLAYEAQTILGPGHRILDLGEEEYTQGRPHPMVDLELRRRMLREDGPGGRLHPARRRARPRLARRSGRRAGRDARRAGTRAAGDRARVRDRRGPAGRAAPGGDPARRGRRRRPDERGRGEAGAGRGGAVKIAMLTYSVKPRGGVVHALEVAEALARRRHEVELCALARYGEALFRLPAVPEWLVRHVPRDVPFDERIQDMLEAYAKGLRPILATGGYDVIHAQDCLSANAALALRDDGVVDHVIRTVHHVDDFTSPSLIACQDRSIVEPDHVLCVSQPWVDRLAAEFGVEADLVRNGVDARRYRPAHDAAERAEARAGLGDRFTVMTVGGIEPRKGSLTLLEGFAVLRDLVPERDPLLLIAGGMTLFDYRHERERFDARAAELEIAEHVRVLGPLEAEAMERLFRAADVFAFPSVKEGFGLAALEALAAELPVVASDLDVFRGFLVDGESALLTEPGDGPALGRALSRVAHDAELADRLRAGGRAVVPSHTWDAAAMAHERAYEAFLGAGVG